MNRISVVLADDHKIVRDGLRVLINAQPDLTVVADVGTGYEAVDRVRESEARVLCLDLSMPGLGGAATIKQVHAASPRRGCWSSPCTTTWRTPGRRSRPGPTGTS